MIMPFGKYKDTPVEDLETDYIKWLSENMEDLRPPLKAALEGELSRRRRAGTNGHQAAKGPTVGQDHQATPKPPAPSQAASAPAAVDDAHVRKIIREEVLAVLMKVMDAL